MKSNRSIAGTIGGLVLAGAVAASGQASAGVASDLAVLRQATAPFHNFELAVLAGWDFQLTGCMESPDGGMGYHYANLGALVDGGVIDPAVPEAILYEPGSNGQLRLVGVEYIILEDDLSRSAPPPELFGQHFHFNDVFDVWALHAWVWRRNSSGMFADWNPMVNCDFAD